jgi:hypothetical protein
MHQIREPSGGNDSDKSTDFEDFAKILSLGRGIGSYQKQIRRIA